MLTRKNQSVRTKQDVLTRTSGVLLSLSVKYKMLDLAYFSPFIYLDICIGHNFKRWIANKK